MKSRKLKKYLPLLIVGLAVIVGAVIVVGLNPNRYLPCALMKIEKKNWDMYTEKENACIRQRAEKMHQVLKDKGIEESKSWPTYTNKKLGISFKYPEYSGGEKTVFIEAGNILFVTTPSSPLYTRRNELPKNGDIAILNKARQISKVELHDRDTFASVDEYLKTLFSGLVGWAIWVRDAKSEEDLSQFIHDRFSGTFKDGCKLGKKFESTQAGIFDVVVEATRGETGYADSSCYNWILYFKYSPLYERAAMWDVGQEAKFNFTDVDPAECEFSYDCSADYLMAKSFTFFKPER